MSDNSFAGINFDDPDSKKIFENHSKMMCSRYKNINENSFVMNMKVKKINNENEYVVSGNVITNPFSTQLFIKYTAANPPTYNGSYSGSGLPHPNEEIAFENTPNRGVVEVINDRFEFILKYPNSYYINMGTIYVEPHVRIVLVNKDNKQIGEMQNISLGEGIPFRTLTWPVQRDWNNGPEFYENKDLPVRSQYQILLDSAYPSTNKMPKNFWGVIPPH